MTRRRGYTIIELMMAISVMAIGVTGVIALQKVVATANRNAKNLAIATHIAQTWVERLHADAAQWNHPSPVQPGLRDIATDTFWLDQVEGNAGVWLQPPWNAALGQGPAFDALGNDVDLTANPGHAKFCTHIRLAWLYADNQPRAGNGLIRAEVRVFWARANADLTALPNGLCDPNIPTNQIGQDLTDFNFVYMTTAVKQATAQGTQ